MGSELRIFSPMEWYQHTHAAAIEGGVISYADPHYSGGVGAEQIEVGMDLVWFLGDASAPSGFPPGSVFMAFGEAHDRADREADVVATLREGPHVEFDRVIVVKMGDPVIFPDQLEILVLGHSHKRPRVDGPTKEWINLELSKDGRRESMALAHCTDIDGTATWERKTWGPYVVEVKDMSTTTATLVVRKPG